MSQMPNDFGMKTLSSSESERDELNRAMDRVAAGDDEAFASVYRCGGPRIFRMLSRLGCEAAAADDLTQETLLRVYRHRSEFQPGKSFMAWAGTIARRLFIDRVRRLVTESTAAEAFAYEVGAERSHRPADDLIELGRLVDRMLVAIDDLPKAQAATLRLVHDEGLSYKEASKRTGESSVCLRLRSHRAVKTLRAALSDELPLSA